MATKKKTKQSPPQTDPNEYEHDSALDTEIDEVPAAQSPSPQSKEEPKKHEHPRGLRMRALQYGAAEADIDATPTNQLYEWVEEQDARVRYEREQNANTRVVQKPQSAPAQAPEEEDDYSIEKTGVDLAPQFKALLKARDKKIKDLEAAQQTKFKELEEREVDRAKQQWIDTVDDAFALLGEDYEDYFGKGTIHDIANDKTRLKRRNSAIGAAELSGTKLPSVRVLAQKLKEAADALRGSAPKAKEEEVPEYAPTSPLKANGHSNGKKPIQRFTTEQFEDAQLATPTNRQGKPKKGKQEAYKAVAREMAEKGIREDDFDQFEEESLLE